MAKKYGKVEDVEGFRFKIFTIIDNHSKPIFISGIRKKFRDKFGKDFDIPHLKKVYLTNLEKRKFIFKFDIKNNEHLEILNRRLGKKGKPEGQPSYYTSIKHIGEFNQIFNIFIDKLGDFLENKEEVNKKVDEICKLLMEFELKNDFLKSEERKTTKPLKKGEIKIIRLNNKEKIRFHQRLKLFLTENSKYKKLSPVEKRTLEDLKKEDFIFPNIQDREFIMIQNKIYDKISKYNSDKTHSLCGEITRKINNLINSFYKNINLTNILNKITKDLEIKS